MDEERISDLESRIAFQEESIDQLSNIVARQEKELDQLKRMVLILSTQIRNGDSTEAAPSADERPPHY